MNFLFFRATLSAVVVCLSVGVLLKRQNVVTQHNAVQKIAQGLFSEAKYLCEIRTGQPLTGTPNARGVRRLKSTNNSL